MSSSSSAGNVSQGRNTLNAVQVWNLKVLPRVADTYLYQVSGFLTG